jgi:hypothetical protein
MKKEKSGFWRWFSIVSWSLFGLTTALWIGVKLGQNHDWPAAPKSVTKVETPARKYPDRILIFRHDGGPDLWQRLSSQRFKPTGSIAKDEETITRMVKLAAMAIGSNGYSCDEMEDIAFMVQGQRAGLRVACIGDDGFYRTYFVSRHIDDKTGPYRAEYLNK